MECSMLVVAAFLNANDIRRSQTASHICGLNVFLIFIVLLCFRFINGTVISIPQKLYQTSMTA